LYRRSADRIKLGRAASVPAPPVDPQLRWRNIAHHEAEVLDLIVAAARRDGRHRAIGKLDDRTAARDAVEQAFQIGHSPGGGEIEQWNTGDDTVEDRVLIIGQCSAQVEGIALDDMNVRIKPAQVADEFGRIFHRKEICRPHATLQDRAGDDPRARPDLQHRQAGSGIDDRCHLAGRDGAGRNDRADSLGAVNPALEELQLVMESFSERPLQSETLGHRHLLQCAPVLSNSSNATNNRTKTQKVASETLAVPRQFSPNDSKKSFMRLKKPLDWGEFSFEESRSNSSSNSRCRRERFCGVSTTVWIYRSPTCGWRSTGMPFPLRRNWRPLCVPSGTFTRVWVPSSVATSKEPPRAAVVIEIGTLQ